MQLSYVAYERGLDICTRVGRPKYMPMYMSERGWHTQGEGRKGSLGWLLQVLVMVSSSEVHKTS